jgi:putative transposase
VRTHSERIAGEWPPSGSRRVSAQLRRAGAGAVNGQRVRRRMGELGLVGPTPVRRCRTTNRDQSSPRSPHLVVDLTLRQPDAVWVADSTDGRRQHDFVYLAVLLDVSTRAIRGWELSRPLAQALTRSAWERAVATGHGPSCAQHPPLRPGRAVRRDGLRRAGGAARGPDQHGRARRATPEWLR